MNFRKDQRIVATRSGAKAVVLFADKDNDIIKIKYDEPAYGEQSYKMSLFEMYWEEDCSEKNVVAKTEKKCDCGCHITYGKNCPLSFHSDWCKLKN